MTRTVVISPVAERPAQPGEPLVIGSTAWRIERPDGKKTGTGLFVSRQFAEAYAEERGWTVATEEVKAS